jgi:hypothetical protein
MYLELVQGSPAPEDAISIHANISPEALPDLMDVVKYLIRGHWLYATMGTQPDVFDSTVVLVGGAETVAFSV